MSSIGGMYGSSGTDGGGSTFVGIAGVVLASLFWGSSPIVCRGYDLPPDGMHFVLLMSTGILFVGLISLFFSPAEDGDYEVVFAPDGLVGGIVWMCGNCFTVPIIQNVGLGVGFSTWAGVNLIVAFIVGVFGFGRWLPGETVNRPALGVAGIVVAVFALILFANVQPTLTDVVVNATNDGEQQEGQNTRDIDGFDLDQPFLDPDNEEEDDESNPDASDGQALEAESKKSKPLGICLAVVAGFLYGFQFVPLSIWHNKVEKAGHIFDQDLPSELALATRFLFSQFAGIFLTSFCVFSLYCIWKRNEPLFVPPEAVMPSILSGIVFAIGCGGGMLATSGLGNAVGFPLVLNGSFLVNSTWSVAYFKEIQGQRNLQLFFGAFVLNVISSILISLSKG